MGLDIDNTHSKTREPPIPLSEGKIRGEIHAAAGSGGSGPAHTRWFSTSDRIDCADVFGGTLWQQ
jgi:hypothetical protein